jgi:DNA repair protein RadC
MAATRGNPGVSNLMAANDGAAAWLCEGLSGSVAPMSPLADPSKGVSADGLAAWVCETGEVVERQRYLQRLSDADALNMVELLELLLHFGPSKNRAVSLAAQLLDRFGAVGAVVAADPVRLSEVLGGDGVSVMLLKTVHAVVRGIVREPLEDRPVIGSASALMRYLSVTMRHESTEATRFLYLDRENALIKDEIHQRGTIDHTLIYTREVIRRVLELGACAVIMVHNHPSGNPEPSAADILMTRELAAALRPINVALHDHVIIGRHRETSFRKLKLL